MVDITSIGIFMASFNNAISIAKAAKDVHDAVQLDQKLFDLNRAMLDTQQAVFAVNEERAALIKRTGELENEIARLRNWEAEKQKYDPVRVAENGPIAYASKEEMAVGKSPIAQTPSKDSRASVARRFRCPTTRPTPEGCRPPAPIPVNFPKESEHYVHMRNLLRARKEIDTPARGKIAWQRARSRLQRMWV